MKIVLIQIDDALSPTAAALISQLQKLATEPDSAAISLVAAEPISNNRTKVRGLRDRCRKAGREVRVADIIAVANLDESEFFKWQRGASVGPNTQRKCCETVALEVEEFLRRLDQPVNPMPSVAATSAWGR